MATNTHHHTLLSALHCFERRRLLLLLLGLVCLCNVVGGSNSTWSRPGGCIDSEREALLQFKRGLPHDPANRLSSWTADGSDCCGWNGVSCDSMSGHVVKLDLKSPGSERFLNASRMQSYSRSLGGVIGPSLLGLKYLAYLDLSYNDFKKKPIPEFLGSLSNLEYLYLSGANLQGRIPHHLGNLSRLQTLDLSNNGFWGLSMGGDVKWMSQLSSLQHLNLYQVDISSDHGSSGKLLVALNMLPSLSWVNLGSCRLKSIPSFPHVNLTSLSFLDLSENDIQSPFVEWLTNITSLEHLDLSWNNFEGGVPSVIWSMSSLTELIISGNERLDGKLPRNQSSLCKLQRLEMRWVNISGDVNELEGSFSGCIRNSLQSLDLRSTRLTGSFPSWLVEMKRLKYLSLPSNSLQGPIPTSLGGLSSLEELDLSENNLNGSIPHSLGGLSRLTSLDLRSNHLQGAIPESLGNLSSLEELFLDHNNLSGPISAEILSSLSSLQLLDLSDNRLEGMVSAAHLSNFRSLRMLSMANNPIIFNISTDWVPPFRLAVVDLSLCKVGPLFPTWLRLQQNVDTFNLSNSGISDAIPDSYWSSTSSINILDLSNNQITGRLLDSLKHIVIRNLDIHSNRLEGEWPHQLPSTELSILDMSSNSFTGAIPKDVGEAMPSLQMLVVSNNKLNGSIPRSLCQLMLLLYLDLSRNNFSGNIPDCWKPSPYTVGLVVLHLSHNSLVGVIPNSLGYHSSLQSLRLNGNSLSGELSQSIRSWSSMSILDLGENKISGIIPAWLPEDMPQLKVLRLCSNNFMGDMPLNQASLTHLQVIDLANNGLTGTIPQSFGNFAAMKFKHDDSETINLVFGPWNIREDIDVMMKGRMLEYEMLQSHLISIDLSNNRLSGRIPQEMANLTHLQILNVSGNMLTGEIMQNISAIHDLESLDLSRNNLSGRIPSQMSSLTFLSHLNLSFNNFSGRIPQGNQFNTFTDPSIYMGNPYLYGFPLDEPDDEVGHKKGDHGVHRRGESKEQVWMYLFTVLGFILGFWAVWGTLIMNERWRTMFFMFVDDKSDQLYVFMILCTRRLKRTRNVRK